MANNPNLIQVRSPEGMVGTIPKENLQLAIERGYAPLSQKEIAHNEALEEAGSGLGPLKAFAESAGSAATFGVLPNITNELGITTPESQALTKEANPKSSAAGTITGIAAPLILSGGAEAPLAAGQVAAEGASAAKAGLGAADLLNPVSGVAKLGQATTEAVAPVVKSAISGISESYPAIGGVINKVAPAAIGGALEGTAFGVGQSLDEHALGDPDALGEHLISNIGLNALVGGGVGSIFGAISKEAAQKIPTAADVLESSGRPIETFEDAVRYGTSENPQTKKTILEGLSELKPHANEIKEAADFLGVPAFAGQLSDSSATQKMWSILHESPSPIGLKINQEVGAAYKEVQAKVENAISSNVTESAADIGTKIKDSLLEKANGMIESYSNKFQELGLTEKAIPVSEKSLSAITRNINKIPEIKGNIAPAFAQNMEGRLATVSTLQDLKTQIKGLNADIYSFNIGANEKRIAIAIKDKLQTLYENTIRRQFSKNDQKELFALYKGANREFSETINKLGELAEGAGKSRIKSPLDFVNFLENKANSDTLVDKLFKKKDSEFLSFFQRQFPEEWNLVKGYQRGKIGEYKDGVLNLNGALKKISSMEPEIKKAVFNPDEIKTLEAAKTWSDSFPKNINPSGTAHTLGWMNYLKNPLDAGASHLRDLGISLGMSSIEHSVQNTAKISALSRLQKAAEQTQNLIESGAKAIFSEKGQAATIGLSGMMDQKETEKTIDKIQGMTSDPDVMMDALHNNTNDLYKFAPGTSLGVQKTMLAATKFLQGKIPLPLNQKILSPKYTPSKSEVFRFNGYLNTIKAPTSVLKGIRHGMVTTDQMESLKAVYPQILVQMQASVMEQLAGHLSKEKEIPYKTKIGLSQFLEQDLCDSMSQQSIMMNQTSPGSGMTGDEKQAAVNPTQKGLGSLDGSSRIKTNLQSIQNGDEA